jgi:hypothetical protein
MGVHNLYAKMPKLDEGWKASPCFSYPSTTLAMSEDKVLVSF